MFVNRQTRLNEWQDQYFEILTIEEHDLISNQDKRFGLPVPGTDLWLNCLCTLLWYQGLAIMVSGWGLPHPTTRGLLVLLILNQALSFLLPLEPRSIPSSRHDLTKVFSASDESGITIVPKKRRPPISELSGFDPAVGGVWPGDPNAKKYSVGDMMRRRL